MKRPPKPPVAGCSIVASQRTSCPRHLYGSRLGLGLYYRVWGRLRLRSCPRHLRVSARSRIARQWLTLPLPCFDCRLSHAPSSGEAEVAVGGSTLRHSPLRRQLRTTWLISCSSYVSSLLDSAECLLQIFTCVTGKSVLAMSQNSSREDVGEFSFVTQY